jgi:hypothetical protein
LRNGSTATDAAEAADDDRLARQFRAHEPQPVPATGPRGLVGEGDFAGDRQQQAHGQLGDGHRVGLQGRDHDDARLRGGIHVDVVEADAVAADDEQAGCGGEHLRGELGLVAHDDGAGAGELFAQARRGLPQRAVMHDVVPLLEPLDRRRGAEGFGDEDVHDRSVSTLPGVRFGVRASASPG